MSLVAGRWLAFVTLAVALAAACRSPREDTQRAAELRKQATAAYDARRYDDCGRYFGQVAARGQAGVDDLYNAACCLALAGKIDQAIARLGDSLDKGFRDPDHLERDPDLAGLRGDRRWRAIVDRAGSNRQRYQASSNGELKQLFEADQGDRRKGSDQIDWARVNERDRARRARVGDILAGGGARHADDYYHAAMVLQHGDKVEDYQRAHQLAMNAVEIDPSHGRARWLAAASKDRELVNSGKPQLYGTQFHKDASGNWARYPVDPSITDEERARWGVEPIGPPRQASK
jgi:hypothetical protein